jgi:hypothetical protein
MGLPVDQQELNRVLGELKIYGDAPGSSFFLIRDAQRKAKERDFSGALKLLDRAVERTPTLLPPYFIRADIRLRAGDIPGADKDLNEIHNLLTAAGGFSEGDEAQAAFLPINVEERLARQLARSIAFSPESADRRLRDWAKTV